MITAQRKGKRIPLADAQKLADKVQKDLLQAGFDKAEVVGSVRRQDAEVGDLDFIVHGDLENVRPLADEVVEMGKDKATIMYDGFQVNMWYSPLESWGAALFHYTGPRGYIIGYKKKAKEKGWKLTEKGLVDESGNLIAAETEESIYRALGKDPKEPHLRGI